MAPIKETSPVISVRSKQNENYFHSAERKKNQTRSPTGMDKRDKSDMSTILPSLEIIEGISSVNETP